MLCFLIHMLGINLVLPQDLLLPTIAFLLFISHLRSSHLTPPFPGPLFLWVWAMFSNSSRGYANIFWIAWLSPLGAIATNPIPALIPNLWFVNLVLDITDAHFSGVCSRFEPHSLDPSLALKMPSVSFRSSPPQSHSSCRNPQLAGRAQTNCRRHSVKHWSDLGPNTGAQILFLLTCFSDKSQDQPASSGHTCHTLDFRLSPALTFGLPEIASWF